ncbi:MAG: glycosyltransferase [Litorimonas sp.]
MEDISVVIPVYRDDDELSGLLRALDDLPVTEIIIVDGEDRSERPLFHSNPTQNIIWQTSKRGRGTQIAAGIAVAISPNIWVLHADCRPVPGSHLEIDRLLADPKTSMTCFPLAFRTGGLSLSLFALLSRIDSPVTTFGDQGFAFRKSDYDGLDLNLSKYPLLEDVALRAACRKLGRIRKARINLPTSARRFESLGIWRTQFRNISILLKYWRGTSPKTLHAEYYQITRQTAPVSRLS